MPKPHWTPDDIPWDQFDPAKVDPDIVPVIKAASLVEYGGRTYVKYLCNVFHDDPEFQDVAHRWGEEEVQHGEVLARWAKLADPSFDFAASYKRFTEGYAIDTSTTVSVRGSRAGEMIARCIVETGTSSHYASLREATDEPVLREVCHRIMVDELRHYKLFYSFINANLKTEGLGAWGRLRVAVSRIKESEDDELAYAYYAANGDGSQPYDKQSANRAYVRRAFAAYRRHHIERVTAMVFKAAGLKPHTWLNRQATRVAWYAVNKKVKALSREAV